MTCGRGDAAKEEQDKTTTGDGLLDANTDEPDEGSEKKEVLVGAAVVLGALLVNVITTGVANTLGIILRSELYSSSSPFKQESKFNMGFVVGTAMGFLFLLGPFGNLLTSRYGARVPIGLGVIIMGVALIMASLAKRFWQLLLSQGILWGLGASLCFVPAMGLPSQFFPQRKGLATGIASSGSSLGAMILSPIIERVVDTVSVPWALRTLGFIILGLGACSTALIRSKLQKGVQGSLATQYKFLDLTVLKVRCYPLYMVFAFLQMFGYSLPVLTLPNYARALGLTNSQGSTVNVILNAGNFVGRLIGGFLGDRLGILNMLSFFTFISGLLCVVAWYFATSFAGLASFAAFWGVGAGAYWSLTVPATATIVGPDRLGSAVSINYLMNVLPPVFSSSIGTIINGATARMLDVSPQDPRSYRYLIVWSGLCYMIPAILLLIVRLTLDRRILLRL